MDVIEAKDLTKVFKTQQREPGVLNTIQSWFKPSFKQVTAVDHISFNIAEGELVGLIGRNGAGKTTTLKMLSGLLYPTSGAARVLGFVPFERKHEFQMQFSFVAGQRNQLWWDLPPSETFLLNKEIYGISDKAYKARVSYLAKILNLDTLLTTPVKKLSLGQRMKAELIASLLHQPRVLFLDEPTIGLDIIAQSNMHQFIRDYNQKFGATIILTSHYMKDVEELCERVIIIDSGKILYDGKLSKLVEKFGKSKTIRLTLGKEVPQEKLSKYGKTIEAEYPIVSLGVERSKAAETAKELLADLEVKDLTIEEIPFEEIVRSLLSKNE